MSQDDRQDRVKAIDQSILLFGMFPRSDLVRGNISLTVLLKPGRRYDDEMVGFGFSVELVELEN